MEFHTARISRRFTALDDTIHSPIQTIYAFICATTKQPRMNRNVSHHLNHVFIVSIGDSNAEPGGENQSVERTRSIDQTV